MGSGARANKAIHIQHLETGDGKNDGIFQPSYIPKFTTVEKFVDAKIKILREHLCIALTLDDIVCLRKCKTETQVNNTVRMIINEHWS